MRYLILVLALAGSLTLQADEEPIFIDSLTAIVGKDAITFQDLTNHTRYQDRFQRDLIMASDVQNKDAALRAAIVKNRELARERLIEEEVIYKDFNAKGFRIPSEILRGQYDDQVRKQAGGDYAKFDAILEDFGMTREEFSERLRRQTAVRIYINEFVNRRIITRPAEVRSYYDANREDFREPADVRLQVILMNPGSEDDATFTQRVGRVASQVAAGKDFLALEKQTAELGKIDASDLGWLNAKKLDKVFLDALGTVRQGQVGGPVSVGTDICFVRIAEARGGEILPFEQVQEAITDRVYREERMRRKDQLVKDLRKRYYVRLVD